MSGQIRELAQALGVDLCVRSGKRLVGLTEPGKSVVAIVERLRVGAAKERCPALIQQRGAATMRRMCTRYISPETADIERHWHIGRHNAWRGGEVFPNYQGPFIRVAREALEPTRELVIGQWSLVPWFAKAKKLAFSTANARSEELTEKASFKLPWARGQRCIIPALAFFEPNWESGKHVPWIFRRTDGLPWGLAGLWNVWTDKASGEMVESYTMLTVNADAHPLMRRMHRPDPKRPPELQDKRSVVPIEPEDVDSWLFGTVAQARSLIRLAPAEAFDGVAAT